MALNGFLKLVGQVQGPIRGSVMQKGREGMIKVVQADHLVATPIDAATLQPTGKRRFGPFFLVKDTDLATIGLRRAHATNESFKEWELKLFSAATGGSGGAAGVERNHLTIKLVDARVSEIGFGLPDTRDPALLRYADFERVGFIYRKIVWTWTDGALTHEDSLDGAGAISRKRGVGEAGPARARSRAR
ncbi:MAG: type VI secretion system tube protein Hcp [Alphaproteobacteria bacterium]|nr:type VI secretion system tube protein Hcp [Alphaproteobacteria bacterium]